MEKKKIKKSDLSGLCRPALQTGTQPSRSAGYYGSGDSDGSYGYGTSGYYTLEEFYAWEGVWPGGWVYGLGYVAPDAVIEGYYPYYGGGEEEEEPPHYYSYSEYDDYEEHNPYDYPTYYYDSTYYYYDPYYDDGYSYGGGGGGGSSSPSSGSSTPQTDGVNISNTNNFKFNTSSSPVFTTQLTRILISNSVIKKILDDFNNGDGKIIFGIANLSNDTGAVTSHDPEKDGKNYYINFNSCFITDSGWSVDNSEGTDNIEFDWSDVKTMEESLLVTLAHEAIHAKYYLIFYTFYKWYETPSLVYEKLKECQPEGFADIFMSKKGDVVEFNDNNEVDDRMHEYMTEHELKNIQAALNEYRKDFPKDK